MVEASGLYRRLKLFHRIRHIGVVLDDGYRAETLIGQMVGQVSGSVGVNGRFLYRVLPVDRLGFLQDNAVVDLCPFGYVQMA
ncbi:Uncharacterised protein [Leclercia adecarboxylata]|nr:Uncharacterised protein [Leclercia adecarboxylata]